MGAQGGQGATAGRGVRGPASLRSGRGASRSPASEAGLTLLQPAAGLQHQPALGLGQLLTEDLALRLHFPQPLLPALRQPQLRADAHQALGGRGQMGGDGAGTEEGLLPGPPNTPALTSSLPPPPGPGQGHSGAATWAGVGPLGPRGSGSRQVLPKQPVSAGNPEPRAQIWEPPPGATPGGSSGGLRAPPAAHSAQDGHQDTPRVQGQAGRFLPSRRSGRAVGKREGEVSRLPAPPPGPPPALPGLLSPAPSGQALTSAGSSLGAGRCRCRRSTSSISYTLISNGSFREPDRGGGRSTHCPGRLGLRLRAAASGSGAGISRRRCRPGTESRALGEQRLDPSAWPGAERGAGPGS